MSNPRVSRFALTEELIMHVPDPQPQVDQPEVEEPPVPPDQEPDVVPQRDPPAPDRNVPMIAAAMRRG